MTKPSEHKFNSLSEASKTYVLENIDAFSLIKREFPYSGSARGLHLGTLKGVSKNIVNDLMSSPIEYLKALILGWREISKLTSIKGSKVDRRAIIIGNGPSQDLIDHAALRKFKQNGNDIHVINYWNTNTRLSSISPSYFITSDPNTLCESKYEEPNSDISKSNANLRKYLLEDSNITIMAPIWQVKYLKSIFGASRVMGFIDTEMRTLSSNIDPRFPRGYLSMTLFKALAIAIHMGYREIYLIGMDNTYPRDIYCDSNNHIYRRERHAGGNDYMVDVTTLNPSMAVQMQDIFNLFSDLNRCFSNLNVLNLDPYSLTDVFPKVKSYDDIDSLLFK
jgi:hypothetical protein